MEEFDLCVIGSGPGGIAAAIEASLLGAKVLVIEAKDIGGVCLNRGCIPTKSYLKSALLYEEFKNSAVFGVSCENINYDFSKIKTRAKDVINSLRIQAELSFKARKINIIKGRAAFLSEKRISVDGKEIGARAFIIATGSSPKFLNGILADNKRIFYSESVLDMGKMPKDITIVGAGPIGCEFASFFRAFGVDVTLIETLDRVMPKEDKDISNKLEGIFRKKGINVLTSVKEVSINKIASEIILISTGRSSNIKDIGIENAGIKAADGGISTDEYLRTSSASIFAAGDCLGKYNLAHTASAEGRIAARNALGDKIKMSYEIVPLCVYSFPETASVGLTAEDAAAKGYEVLIARQHFASLGRSQTQGETEGFIKLVADKKNGFILGGQILGYCASELIGLIGMAIKGKFTVKALAEVIQAHPTLSESVQEAALNICRQIR
ncbi:MAG: dihydrolipoyl dehydrogenase [Candidatus Omnitrophota bacterium]